MIFKNYSISYLLLFLVCLKINVSQFDSANPSAIFFKDKGLNYHYERFNYLNCYCYLRNFFKNKLASYHILFREILSFSINFKFTNYLIICKN